MSVAFDAVSNVAATNSTSVTVALTVANNACLVAVVGYNGAGLSVSSMLANGVAMTQIKRVEGSNTGGTFSNQVFVLTAAPSGVVSVSCNVVGGAAHGTVFIVASYTGQRTNANPFSAIATLTSGAVTNNNLSVSSSTIDRVVATAAGTNSFDSTCTLRARDGQHFGTYFGDTAGSINGTSGFSATFSQSVGTGYCNALMLINIAGVRATSMDIREFHRLMTGVGF